MKIQAQARSLFARVFNNFDTITSNCPGATHTVHVSALIKPTTSVTASVRVWLLAP